MIQIIPAEKRYYAEMNWLQAFWLFSFANYYDPTNLQFGPLRVYNDDIVKPHTGYPTHAHKNFEIITIVLSGEITHYDSLGNKMVMGADSVHRLYCGSGIRHSELNFTNKPAHYHQLWIQTPIGESKPVVEQTTFKAKKWCNRLYPLASGQNFENALNLHSDVNIYRCELESGKILFFDLYADRRVFVYVISGTLSVNHSVLKPGYQARIDLEKQLIIKAKKTCSYILIDLPCDMGVGYSEKTLKGVKLKHEKTE